MAKIVEAIKNFFQTQYERCEEAVQMEKPNTLPSETIPDQSLSIPEIMKRYARGQSLGGALDGYYELDEQDNGVVLPDLDKMDLVEIEQLKKDTAARVKELREQIEKSQSEEAKEFRLQEERRQKIGSMLLHMADNPGMYENVMKQMQDAINSKAPVNDDQGAKP